MLAIYPMKNGIVICKNSYIINVIGGEKDSNFHLMCCKILKLEVVNGLEKVNETVPTNTVMFTHNFHMCRGYCIDSIPDVLGKCASSHCICNLLPHWTSV
jgi:hypothetical protein